METLYRKVAASKEPKHNGNYHCIFPEGQIFTIPFLKEYGFHDEFTDCSGITHYLEEIPDPTAKLKADKAELLELRSTIEEFRDKANQSADNLHKRGLQSSGMCSQAMETAYNLCLIEIESLIQKMKKCQENTSR